MTGREWSMWLSATLAVAALTFTGLIQVLPRLIEARALARFGTPNIMHFEPFSDAGSGSAVRPSPDLLTAACPFDLTNGPVRVTAPVPHSTYWSISGYDAAANSFFVRDDQQIAGDTIEIIALRRGMKLPPLGDIPDRVIVFAPGETGLFLLRYLIPNETNMAAIDATRRQATCGAAAAPDNSR